MSSAQFLRQECGICLEIHFCVMRLSCSHSMCQICFAKLSSVNDGIITCPFCRTVVETKHGSNVKKEISHKLKCSACECFYDGFHIWLCDTCIVFVCSTCRLKLKVHTDEACNCTEYDIDSLNRICAAYVQLVFSSFLAQRTKTIKDDLQYAVYLSLYSQFDKIVLSIGKVELPDLTRKPDTLLRKPQHMLALLKICLQFATNSEETDVELSPLMEQVLLQKFHMLTLNTTKTSSSVNTQTDDKILPHLAENTSIAVQTAESIVADINKESKPYVAQNQLAYLESNFEIELPDNLVCTSRVRLLETRQYYIIFGFTGKLDWYIWHKGTHAIQSRQFPKNSIFCDAQCRDYFGDTIIVLLGRRVINHFFLFEYDLEYDYEYVNMGEVDCGPIIVISSNDTQHAIMSRSGNCIIEIPRDGPLYCHFIKTKTNYQPDRHVLPREAHVYAIDESTDKSKEIVVFGLNGMLQCGEVMKPGDRTLIYGIKNVGYGRIHLVFRYPFIYVLMNKKCEEKLLIFDIETGGSPNSNLTIVANNCIDNILIMTEPGLQQYLTTILIKDDGKQLMFKNSNFNMPVVIKR